MFSKCGRKEIENWWTRNVNDTRRCGRVDISSSSRRELKDSTRPFSSSCGSAEETRFRNERLSKGKTYTGVLNYKMCGLIIIQLKLPRFFNMLKLKRTRSLRVTWSTMWMHVVSDPAARWTSAMRTRYNFFLLYGFLVVEKFVELWALRVEKFA